MANAFIHFIPALLCLCICHPLQIGTLEGQDSVHSDRSDTSETKAALESALLSIFEPQVNDDGNNGKCRFVQRTGHISIEHSAENQLRSSRFLTGLRRSKTFFYDRDYKQVVRFPEVLVRGKWGKSPIESKYWRIALLERKLNRPMDAAWDDTPLSEAVAKIEEVAGLDVTIDDISYEDAFLMSVDVPRVNAEVKGAPVEYVLGLVAEQLDWEVDVTSERIMLRDWTSPPIETRRESHFVGDLFIPGIMKHESSLTNSAKQPSALATKERKTAGDLLAKSSRQADVNTDLGETLAQLRTRTLLLERIAREIEAKERIDPTAASVFARFPEWGVLCLFHKKGDEIVVDETFADAYENACEALGVEPILERHERFFRAIKVELDGTFSDPMVADQIRRSLEMVVNLDEQYEDLRSLVRFWEESLGIPINVEWTDSRLEEPIHGEQSAIAKVIGETMPIATSMDTVLDTLHVDYEIQGNCIVIGEPFGMKPELRVYCIPVRYALK